MVDRRFVLGLCFVFVIAHQPSWVQANDCYYEIRGKTSGTITSPNYPKNYGNSLFCTWVIIVQTGSQVELDFKDVSLEKNNDYVRLLDGGRCAAKHITQFFVLPKKKFISTAHTMTIIFQSNAKISAKGFSVNFKAVKNVKPSTPDGTMLCGGKITDQKGTITSPGFPGKTTNNTFCVWQFSSAINMRFQMTFKELKIDKNDGFLTIFTGDSCSNPELTLDQSREEFSHLTQIGQTTVLLSTNSIESNNGFEMVYTSAHKELNECYQEITGKTSGTITSPNYPNGYGYDLFCTWVIHVVAGSQVELNFTHFTVERYHDYVRLFDGDSCAAKPITRFDQLPTKKFISTGNTMTIIMQSDADYDREGFSANFKSVKNVKPSTPDEMMMCGGKISNPKGTVTSPGYPGDYDDYDFCVWQISSSSDARLQLQFEELEVHPQQWVDGLLVSDDFVSIFTGNSCKNPEVKLDQSRSPFNFTTKTGRATILFSSNSIATERGFKMSYQPVRSSI